MKTDYTSASSREQLLRDWLRKRGSVLLGFSGGVDSTFLAAVASEVLPEDSFAAVIGRSPSYPAAQWSRAVEIASALGVKVVEVDTNEMENPAYRANNANRCYFCKSELWSRLTPIAERLGLACVIDGTNADDLSDHRPGRQAAIEAGVHSPLAELGFSKAEIREGLKRRGIQAWSQPSSPCLSSRIAYGISVTPLRLARIEVAEAALRGMGFNGDLRVRSHDTLARVELDSEGMTHLLRKSLLEDVRCALLEAGFERVAVDLGGFRSGSMNVLVGASKL